MSVPIEDYAFIGDCRTAALVSRDGSIDWLCLPRYDAGACFAALLGTREHGRWRIAPRGEVRAARRRYRGDGLVLETELETSEGAVTIVDCMPLRNGSSTERHAPHVVREVIGRRGRVAMEMELVLRFDYGSIVPWVRSTPHGLTAISGPDAVVLRAPVRCKGKDLTTVASFEVSAGERLPFVLSWYESFRDPPPPIDASAAIAATERFWEAWARGCGYQGPWREAVVRSLVTLKGLAEARTGGIVAAATTSLPEAIGGVRNWDYRFCWLRDATFTLYALMHAGYRDEAAAWREWLLRAVAGNPSALQIMYGLAGERRLTEYELPWLPGYEKSAPVRVGNAAHGQLQLDVYGELMDAMHQCWRHGLPPDEPAWQLQRALLDWLEGNWEQPDEGIWEVRGGRKNFTHSKVMAWVALDRAIKTVENFGAEGPVDRWKKTRADIHEQVCRRAYDAELGAFVQHYGAKELDASLLLIPLVGFLPADDARVRGTIEAIDRHLTRDGFVLRYRSESSVDGLPGGEGVFLACSFWMCDCLALVGRRDEARARFERLLAIRNDLGLLAEEYDPARKRQVGNFPQAFSHVSLVNTAFNLGGAGPAESRRRT